VRDDASFHSVFGDGTGVEPITQRIERHLGKVVRRSGAGHGTLKATCPSCRDILDYFGVSH
jgi:hypothetical protein